MKLQQSGRRVSHPTTQSKHSSSTLTVSWFYSKIWEEIIIVIENRQAQRITTTTGPQQCWSITRKTYKANLGSTEITLPSQCVWL